MRVAVCVGALLAAPSWAVPYAGVVLDEVVSGPAPTIYLGGLEAAVGTLAVHASRVPVRFDHAQDRARARDDAQQISDALEGPSRVAGMPAQLQCLAGHWNTLAWRVGYGEAAGRAMVQLKACAQQAPDNLGAAYLLGSFYTEFEGGSRLALPLLERAHDGGLLEATYTLGMLYIQLRDSKTARTYLEQVLVRSGSRDAKLLKLINELRHGDGGWTLTRKLPPLPDQ